MSARRARSGHDSRRRVLGQNFLASSALAARLVRDAAVTRSDVVVEIGAGTGILTAELARRAGRVHAIELDPVWAARLRERLAGCRTVEVIEGAAGGEDRSVCRSRGPSFDV